MDVTSSVVTAGLQVFAAEELKYVYSPEHEPIGSVQPGERFVVDTSDCFTGRYRDPVDFNAESAAWVDANLNPVTGPITVAGAVPGGAVEVAIEDIAIPRPAWSSSAGVRHCLRPTGGTRRNTLSPCPSLATASGSATTGQCPSGRSSAALPPRPGARRC